MRMSSSRHSETERTYDPGPAAVLPTLDVVDGVSAVGQPEEHQLVAVYFDTADLDLARRGITVRRRTGGDDDGWHLKLPAGVDTRTEVRLPPGRATKTVPSRLLASVRGLVRDRTLVPIARVTTRRSERHLIGEGDSVAAHLCVDEVQAERLVGPAQVQDWREWEVELDQGTELLLDAVESLLVAAGATRAASPTKLLRTLGDLVPAPRPKPSREQLARGSAGDLVVAHLAEHLEKLLTQDARLRADEPGSVHKLRIAARRLRSALKTYGPLLEPSATDAVGEELRWLGQVLSGARDAQVMRERLGKLVSGEPAELVIGPVARHIDDDLSAAYQAGRKDGLQALDSERYFRLLDALESLVLRPTLTEESAAPATEVVPRLLRRDAKRLRRAVRDVTRSDDQASRDLSLHEARKKAKRLRYAAESAVPVLPRAKKLAARAKSVQEALGDHQDSVVARSKLREYGAQTQLGGENGFTFGRLHALEQNRGLEAERRFEAAYSGLTRKKLASWTQA
jgi:CHAD domain-containing protein